MTKDQPTMVERVARAMCNQYLKSMLDNETRREAVVEYEWHEWEGEATAAINAMRKPTDAMMLAAVENSGPVGCCCIDNKGACEVWQAMIDAAQMKEPGK